MQFRTWAVLGSALFVAPVASAATFSEDFDDGAAAGRWTLARTSDDTGANFAFDYSGVLDYTGSGIGAPRSGQTTHRGLQLWANRGGAAGSAIEGINAYMNGLDVTGTVTMEFDMYARFGVNSGTSLYGNYGLNHTTQNGTWNSLGIAADSGYWFTATNDGVSTSDYRAHERGTALGSASDYLDDTQNNTGAGYQALFPDLDGGGAFSIAGTPANRWVTVRLTRNADTNEVIYEMKNPGDASFTTIFSIVDDSPTQTNGTVTLGMTDPFSSASPTENYFIFDNLTVIGTPVPEPASLSLLALAGASLLRRRR